jgi:hypothetical protein
VVRISGRVTFVGVLAGLATAAALGGCHRNNDPVGLAQLYLTFEREPAIAATASTHDDRIVKVANAGEEGERIQLAGFSVVAPQGADWIEGPRLPEPDPRRFDVQWRLQFRKAIPQIPGKGPHVAFTMVGTALVPDSDKAAIASDERSYLRSQMDRMVELDKASASNRMTLTSQKAALDRSLGYACFRYDGTMEDRGVAGFEGSVFTIDARTLTCIDPGHRFFVMMTYTQRTPPGAPPAEIAREGERFFRSLQFASPQG